MYTPDTIAKVKEASDIVEVIGEYLPNLKRAGKDYKGLCPFHNEKTPSFMVSPAKGIYHCFGCSAGGDVFQFVMQMERLTYPEVVEKLAARANIPIVKTRSDARFEAEEAQRKKLLSLTQRAKEFFKKSLWQSAAGRKAQDYLLKKRGLSLETIEKFELGWAQGRGTLSIGALAAKAGLKTDELNRAGLLRQKHDWFQERVIFPIFDLKGQAIAFGGRILETPKNASGFVPPKYLNSPETPIFHKGRNLYGLLQAAASIRESRKAIILEGYMDVISAHQAGLKQAVAPLGTAFTLEQCQLLKRYAEEVIVLFDSDNAGRAAALRASELLLSSGFLPRVAVLSDCKDVDEYLQKHSLSELWQVLEKAPVCVEYKLLYMLEQNQKLSETLRKKLALESVLPDLRRVANPVILGDLAHRTAQLLDVREEAVLEEIKRTNRKAQARQTLMSRSAESAASTKKSPPRAFLNLEEDLLCFVLQTPSARAQMEKELGAGPYFSDPQLDAVYEAARGLTLNDLMSMLTPEQKEFLSGLLAKAIHSDKEPSEILQSLLQRFARQKKSREAESLRAQVLTELSQGKTSQALKRYQTLLPQIKSSKNL